MTNLKEIKSKINMKIILTYIYKRHIIILTRSSIVEGPLAYKQIHQHQLIYNVQQLRNTFKPLKDFGSKKNVLLVEF